MAGKKEKDLVRLAGGVSGETPGTHGDDPLPRSPDGVKEMGTYRRTSILNQEEKIRMLGKMLKEVRASVGMTRKELAKRMECKYEDIRLYENGERSMRVDRLFQILDVLGYPFLECLTENQVCEAMVRTAMMKPEYRRKVYNCTFAALKQAAKTPEFLEQAENEG